MSRPASHFLARFAVVTLAVTTTLNAAEPETDERAPAATGAQPAVPARLSVPARMRLRGHYQDVVLVGRDGDKVRYSPAEAANVVVAVDISEVERLRVKL